MASQHYVGWLTSHINAELKHKASEICEVGDLTFWDAAAHAVRSARFFPDTADGPTQIAFAPLYTGMSLSKQLANDPILHNASLYIDHIWELPCVSGIYLPGDYVTLTWAANALTPQLLKKAAAPTAAIGHVLRDYPAAATKIKVRLWSALLNRCVRPA